MPSTKRRKASPVAASLRTVLAVGGGGGGIVCAATRRGRVCWRALPPPAGTLEEVGAHVALTERRQRGCPDGGGSCTAGEGTKSQL